MRTVRVIALSVVASALLTSGQLWVARAADIVRPAQDYSAGNDSWPFQQFLLAWYTASAVAGAAGWAVLAGGDASPPSRRWMIRVAAALSAGAGGVVAAPMAYAWSAGAVSVADTAAVGVRAVVVGLIAGVVAALAVSAGPAARRGYAVWIAWTWATALLWTWRGWSATPFGLPATAQNHTVAEWLALFAPLLVFAGIGVWCGLRKDRSPIAAGLTAPVLLCAVSTILVQFNGGTGDHYNPSTEAVVWFLLSGVGGGVTVAIWAAIRWWRLIFPVTAERPDR
ncbi:MAG: hypothetical protein HOU81_09905 [Hamadaea sp.]|uniref:hypothetical protein n=1 Tax=Hamadaea sp. TaxID=2024425 RepID=UPI001834CFAA|nr:hypothetical protein [Hamadaea sp.]NUR71124.1 hypothetical protein [Hamadaea sp.]NUT23370.1 hypothetical protein [Hamadaea sp.]